MELDDNPPNIGIIEPQNQIRQMGGVASDCRIYVLRTEYGNPHFRNIGWESSKCLFDDLSRHDTLSLTRIDTETVPNIPLLFLVVEIFVAINMNVADITPPRCRHGFIHSHSVRR